MNISENLRKLARTIQSNADSVLQVAENSDAYPFVVDSIASSIDTLESTAATLEEFGLDAEITENDLDAMAAIAEEFDKSRDPLLKKQASVLDEILRTFGTPKGEVARIKAQAEAEIEQLRAKYRSEKIDGLYGQKNNVREALNKQNNVDKVRAAVQSQVKQYRPLEASLSTRYPPDMPGGHQVRISDSIYQDVLTGKIYDYKNGYTTAKGNKVPGTAVEYQIPDVGSLAVGDAVFETRQSVMSKAAESKENIVKQAGESYFKAVIDLAPPEAEEFSKELCKASGISDFKITASPRPDPEESIVYIYASGVEKLAPFAMDHPIDFGWIYPGNAPGIPIGTDEKFLTWAKSRDEEPEAN
jgi:hypothetical protein